MGDGHRIARNSIFLFALTFSNYFIGLLLFPFISRVLSVNSFGIVGFGMAYAMVFQSIVEFGFMISTTARISRVRSDATKVSEAVTNTMLAKGILLFISTLIFILSAPFVQMVRDHLLVMSLFFLSAATAAMVPDFYFRGMEQMQSIATRAIAARSLSIVIVLALVRGDHELAAVPMSLLASNLVAVLWAFMKMRRLGFRFSQPSIGGAIVYLKESFMYFLSRVSATINQSMGAFTLGLVHTGPSYEMGVYSAAWRVSSAGEMMLLPVSDSLYPHMINKRDYRLFWRVYFPGLVLWFLGCAFVFIFASSICSILLGPQYASAGAALRILLFGCFMAFSSNMFGYNALAPIGLARHANFSLILSVSLNAVAMLTLFALNKATLTSICTVVTLSNLVIFAYRFSVFMANKDLALSANNK
ncbi:oligosaccharide flippase family protein [Caulobacter sp.]|uniref:oligosaccharide flippase family protein n=1 Tax=Caulobacter sp. TaxID=78 RepID=UPI0031DB1D25